MAKEYDDRIEKTIKFCYPSKRARKNLFFANGFIEMIERPFISSNNRTEFSIKMNFKYMFWLIILTIVSGFFFIIPILIFISKREGYMENVIDELVATGNIFPINIDGSNHLDDYSELELTIVQKHCPYCGFAIEKVDQDKNSDDKCPNCGIKLA